MCLKSEANKGQQYHKWSFAVSEINKIGIGFISIFLLKARVSYLTILERKNLSLPLKDETDQFVTCLVLPECLSVKIAFHLRTVKRIVIAPMPSLLFRSFKNSSPREKVGNCLRFGTGGWSLCFYPLLSRNIWIFFPTLTMAVRAKKKFWQSDLLAQSELSPPQWLPMGNFWRRELHVNSPYVQLRSDKRRVSLHTLHDAPTTLVLGLANRIVVRKAERAKKIATHTDRWVQTDTGQPAGIQSLCWLTARQFYRKECVL